MGFGRVLGWLAMFVIGSLIVSFLIYPQSFQSFKANIVSKINTNAIASLSDSSNFACEEQLKDWLKTDRIKLPSSVSVSVIEKKSFTDKTKLLEYIDKWNAFNEYEIKKKIEELTKMPEAQGTYDLRQEDKIFILDFDYEEGEINSMRLVVTRGYFDKEIICNKSLETSKGTIECDVSEYGDGEYKAEAYLDTIDKIWQGKIDTVLIKEEGEIEYTNIAVLTIGICDNKGNLIFN